MKKDLIGLMNEYQSQKEKNAKKITSVNMKIDKMIDLYSKQIKNFIIGLLKRSETIMDDTILESEGPFWDVKRENIENVGLSLSSYVLRVEIRFDALNQLQCDITLDKVLTNDLTDITCQIYGVFSKWWNSNLTELKHAFDNLKGFCDFVDDQYKQGKLK